LSTRRKSAVQKPSASKQTVMAPAAAAVKPALVPAPAFVSRVKENEYELPSYDVTRITLIAKDPHWIYAYWEISGACLDSVRRELGGSLDGCRHVIRMYDVTLIDFNGFNANHWYDIEVGPHATNWYINLWQDSVSYCADLGIIAPSGRFFQMARSNFVNTPRVNTSDRIDEIWMDLKGEFNNWPEAIRHEHRSFESPLYAQYYKGIMDVQPSPRKGTRRRIYLTEDDIRRYYGRLSPLLKEIMFARLSRNRLYRYLYPGQGAGASDTAYYKSLSRGALRKILLGASDVMFLGGSESLQQGASESIMGPAARKFFFEIGAELIVYGRTEPDAEVRLGDEKVDLRPDGTFSMRFALPDGKIPLPFTAVSKDKIDVRKITTVVERNTTK